MKRRFRRNFRLTLPLSFFEEEETMADNSGSGSAGILGVIVGAILVVGVGFYFLQHNGKTGGTTTGVSISVPSAPSK